MRTIYAELCCRFSSNYKNTFVYSITNFNTFRGGTNKNDIYYQNNKVIITSVGTGFSYGKLGYTHYGARRQD